MHVYIPVNVLEYCKLLEYGYVCVCLCVYLGDCSHWPCFPLATHYWCTLCVEQDVVQ